MLIRTPYMLQLTQLQRMRRLLTACVSALPVEQAGRSGFGWGSHNARLLPGLLPLGRWHCSALTALCAPAMSGAVPCTASIRARPLAPAGQGG